LLGGEFHPLTIPIYYEMNDFENGNWMIHNDGMKTKYKLLVKDSGHYAEDSLTKLIWTVFKHRCHHFLKREGWRD
jgi:hypothetical protein